MERGDSRSSMKDISKSMLLFVFFQWYLQVFKKNKLEAGPQVFLGAPLLTTL